MRIKLSELVSIKAEDSPPIVEQPAEAPIDAEAAAPVDVPAWANKWNADQAVEDLTLGDEARDVRTELYNLTKDMVNKGEEKLSKIWQKLTKETRLVLEKAYQGYRGSLIAQMKERKASKMSDLHLWLEDNHGQKMTKEKIIEEIGKAGFDIVEKNLCKYKNKYEICKVSNTKTASVDIGRLDEIRDEIIELMHEARKIIQNTTEEGRFKGYVYGHVISAMGSDDYATYASTFEQIIKALREQEEFSGVTQEDIDTMAEDEVITLFRKVLTSEESVPDSFYEMVYGRLLDFMSEEKISELEQNIYRK
jgi:hypothetical protein